MKKSTLGKCQKLLMVAYVYPPIAYGGTYRSLRMSKYLAQLDCEVTVLTINRQNGLHNDDELLANIPSDIAIERTPTIDPWRSYQKIKDRLRKGLPGKILAKILSFFLYLVNQPDHMIFWVFFAVWRGKKLIKNKNISVIYTSTPPHSGQLIGYFLKKLTGVKWIADLRDPIIGNLGGAHWGVYETWINTHLERMICGTADHVVANTEHARKSICARYPNCVVSTVRNSFDPEEFNGVSPTGSVLFTIAHVGSLYSFRKIDTILIALEAFVVQNKLSPRDICLRLVGLNDRNIIKQISESKISSYVSVENMVPHAQAIQIMMESALLLLIKGSGPDSGAQIPGKLYEYLGSGNKVLYLGPANVEAADIIRESESGYIVEGDAREIVNILSLEFNAWSKRDDKSCTWVLNEKVEQFSALAMARKIKEIISKIT